ncbi:N-acetylmuramoyl-L-alanine amidase [Arsenicicoccus bolidensis]|uniref:N-acetylmuramoyl-L-alanine amidase n=1 Tax=Arsenicicoccus bolidensis TaxID=229480 RepID=UPI0004000C37|nr:N-acetylmuramoyl-L-alanine amidase [Arsenicicoccus bolidensis]
MKTSRTTLVKGTTLLSATLGLSFGFVALPSVAVQAPVPSAVPAKNGPITPDVKKHALADKVRTTVQQAGPQTKVVQDASLPKDAAGKPVATPGKGTVDPALEAGATTDTVVDLPATGNLVGVTWPGTTTMAAKATVAVRAQTAKGWQEWQELAIDAVKEQTTGKVTKYGTEPIWVDGATRVQVRVAASAKDLLKTASLAAVTSRETAADAQLTPTAVAGAANAAYVPSVISRAGWGANESLRKGCVPSVRETSKVVVVHHTAGQNSYTKAQSASIIRGIYAYDTGGLGWCDVAYNMIVDKYGQKFEGRFGGLSRPVKGAHADSFNNYTFGISILGNYDTTRVPEAGMSALKQGIAMRLSQFYIAPYGSTTLYSEYNGTTSRYAKGSAYYAKNIAAHRESSNTACPGRYLYPRMDELRAGAAALAGWNGSGFNSPIYKRYVGLGGMNSLGRVAIGESTVSNGLLKTVFTGGKRIYSGPGGTRVLGSGMENTWGRYGSINHGYPASDELTAVDGTYMTTTRGKVISWNRGNGGVLSGSYLQVWLKGGGSRNATLGAAAGPVGAVRGGTAQAFTRGSVYTIPGTSGYPVAGGMRSAYNSVGSSNSRLGLPTSGEKRLANGIVRQNFQGGYITLVSGQGASIRVY